MRFFIAGRHLLNAREIVFARHTDDHRFEIVMRNGTTVWINMLADWTADEYLSLFCDLVNEPPVSRRKTPHQLRMASRRGS